MSGKTGAHRCLVGARGVVGVAFAGRSFLLKPGMVIQVPDQVTAVSITAGAQTGAWEVIELGFTGPRAGEYAAFLIARYGHGISPDRPARAAALLRTFARGDKVAPQAMERAVFRWFTETHRGAETRRANLGRFLAGSRDTLITTAAEHGFSLAAMAAHFSCSPAHLSVRLGLVWNMPAGALLREARWLHARRLMSDTRLSLRDIGTQCGYTTPAAFNAAFKKRFGTTPGRLREDASASTRRAPAIPAHPAPGPSRAPSPPRIRPAEHAAVVPGGPYFQFDGGEVSYPFETPYKLAVNTVSDAMQWVCTLDGHAIFEVGDHRIPVHPGTVLMFPQPINAHWITPDRTPWHRVWLKLRGSWALDTLSTFVAQHGWLVTIPLRSCPVSLARNWVSHWQQHRDRLSLDGSEAGFDWFLAWRDLVRSGRVTSHPAPDMRQFASRSFFRRLKTVTAYAKEIGYSRSYLSRKLKTQWTETPKPGLFFRRSRLTNAAHELRQTELPVAEIARRALYAHTSTFVQAFRKAYGTTPLQYRLHGTDRV